ncbi:hypothetical protein FQN54_000163 [Arachnomyces sp. PD_36]|nr:hypothetical protein FQN54_000163 [Arachnomyces sp. PD_36]
MDNQQTSSDSPTELSTPGHGYPMVAAAPSANVAPINSDVRTVPRNLTAPQFHDIPNGTGLGMGSVDLDAWDFGLLGDESLWSHMIFSGGQSDAPFRQHQPLPTTISVEPSDSRAETKNLTPLPVSVTPGSEVTSSEAALLRHFVDFAVPPILIGVEPRWNSARVSLLRMAKSSPPVRHAICAFSALSLTESSERTESSRYPSSTHYYELGLSGLREVLDHSSEEVDTATHEIILACVFFLSYVELMMVSSPKNLFELLHRAHEISNNKTEQRTLLGAQLRTWLKILDAKIVSAGGDGIHLLTTPDVQDLEGFGDGLSPPNDQDAEISGEGGAAVLETEDILYNSLNRLAYNFFLQVLTFSGRIAQLDPWHRTRGSVADEFDVMLTADKIVKDLGTLWTRRPAIVDLADKGDKLRQHLAPDLAVKIEQNLRTYSANFYACYIHLQRVAYTHLPLTPQAKRAIDKIIRLVRLSVSEGRALPVSMLWPLMMASCEVDDAETREWLIQRIEGMKSSVGNASRTGRLVREIVKKQSQEGKRADARGVMHELFGSVFAII